MKHCCCKCGDMAKWMHMSTDHSDDSLYCDGDNCVPRGCSCNEDPETGIEYVDNLGRHYPCCEYMFFDNGIDISCDDCHNVLDDNGICSEAPAGSIMCGRKEHGKHPNGNEFHTNCWACKCYDPIDDCH